MSGWSSTSTTPSRSARMSPLFSSRHRPPLRAGPLSSRHSAASAEHGKKPGLAARTRRDRLAFAERAAGPQHVDLRLHDLAAGFDEVIIERRVLPGGSG